MRRSIHFKPWYLRPLKCLFGFHHEKPHPGIPNWNVCRDCDWEGDR